MLSLDNKDIGIDLGTSSVLVSIKGKGIILKEDTIIAISKTSKEVIAIGAEAKEMLGKNPSDIDVIKPMKDGVIADFIAIELFLKTIMKKVYSRYRIKKPKVVVGIPSGITEVEQRAVQEVIIQCGAREVYFIEEPMAAAIGSGIDVSEPTGNIIVDIGAGTTEVAIISLGGIVASSSIKIAGDELDENIINYIKREFNVLSGPQTAENIKLHIGSANPESEEEKIIIKGRDLVTGLPKSITINTEQVYQAIQESILEIIDCVKSTLEKTPPEIASDLAEKGIWLSGGGALIKNLDELLKYKTGMEVFIAENPLECVAKGTEKSLHNLDKLKNNIK